MPKITDNNDVKTQAYLGGEEALVLTPAGKLARVPFETLRSDTINYQTKADMDAAGVPANGQMAKVWNDATEDNNGEYGWSGAEWVPASATTLNTLKNQAKESEKTTEKINSTGLLASPEIDVNEVDGETLRELKQVFSIADQNGNSPLTIDELGTVNIPTLSVKSLKFGNIIIESESYNYDIAIADENGNVLSGTIAGVIAKSTDVNNETILSRDNKNKEAARTKSAVGYYARPFFDLNHIVVYGQSLSTGYEGWPALSKTQQRGCLMLGDCVRPSSGGDPVFTPIGVEQLNPLIANVNNGSTILTDAEVAALPAGSGREGETVNFGMANAAARAQQRAFNNSGVIVTTNSGVAGKTIEQLSKTNTQDSTNRYNRFIESVRKVQTLATADTKTHGVTAIVWMQGEWNYSDHGGSWDKATYKTLFKQLFDDMRADAITETGQEDPPIFITYQTGDSYTRDVDSNSETGLFIGEAQWETTQENTGMYLAGPIYAYTDKGGHMDSNGYRWYGNLLAKVYEKVVIKGEEWKPLHPLSATYKDTELIIDFYVPEPPLVFDVSYDANIADMYDTKGFRITDSVGDEILITNVEIIGDTLVKINTETTISSDCKVWYASQTSFSGNGNLRDSDAHVANDIYEYLPGSGMYESANIPELVNKPYPMHNWCIAFTLIPEAA